MSQVPFTHLFSPLRIGSMRVRNRIVVPAHATRFEDADGMPNARLRDYWLAKARGGAGLIMTHGHGVMSPALHPTPVALQSPRFVDAYAPIVEAIHQQGCPLLLQLNHLGGLGNPRGTGGVSLGPSAVLGPGESVPPVEMSPDHIASVIDAYCVATRRAREAGFDGVEIMAEVSYLITQFMSPLFNRRRDHYGGSLENRLRFAREVIAAVRDAIGTDRVVGLRLAGDQFVAGGLELTDMCEIAPLLEQGGGLDFMHIGAGPGAGAHVPPSYYRPGSLVYLTEALRKVTSLPLIISQRISDPKVAEDVLARGIADLVSMNRALIADPELPNKARTGRMGEIRRCIACNECIGRFGDGLPIACSINPDVGREASGPLFASPRPRTVLVVGAGPAGLEAARVAALRGHRVRLLERDAEIGGQTRIAARAPLRDELGHIARFYEAELTRLGVEIQLETLATADRIRRDAPDVVILATGSRALVPEIEIRDGAHVVDARDVLAGSVATGARVAVIAGERHIQGLCVADLLASQGHAVEVVTSDFYAGALLDQSTRNRLYDRLLRHGVRLTPLTTLVGVRGDTLDAVCAITRVPKTLGPFDTIALAYGGTSESELARELEGMRELQVIGDALAPRRIMDAIVEGARAGAAI